jgi:hypothetical protein
MSVLRSVSAQGHTKRLRALLYILIGQGIAVGVGSRVFSGECGPTPNIERARGKLLGIA